MPFRVHCLEFNRSKYDREAWIELAGRLLLKGSCCSLGLACALSACSPHVGLIWPQASAAERSQGDVLAETLLDLLLLSRARFLAGSMYGNVPRLALQLRPTTPGDQRRLAYVTTDGRDWCTATTCVKNNMPTGQFW